MMSLKDMLVLAVTMAVEIYAILLAGRYFGWNETTMDVWAATGVLALFVTSRYFAWRRH